MLGGRGLALGVEDSHLGSRSHTWCRGLALGGRGLGLGVEISHSGSSSRTWASRCLIPWLCSFDSKAMTCRVPEP